MDYSKMSDFEINKAVAESVFIDREGLEVVRSMPARNEVTVFADKKGELVCIAAADYCNNAAAAWPIITEKNISIILDNPTMPCATANARDLFDDANPIVSVSYDKPLRAAMIVYLQLQEAK
ncbi:phage protein NinX family protein [Pseudescherichia sp.]|uniref:phage protein NinX family protein n=1 Tax=Pseudescherichia sp. TaxID=2055881 RepID=UPI0028A2AD44|nr:phage protein NinX family protein [Pseudescherichia sp.]